LTASIENQKSRTDSVITDFQDRFLKGQTERNEKIEQLIEQTKSEFNELISTSRSTYDEQINIQQEKYNSSLKCLSKYPLTFS